MFMNYNKRLPLAGKQKDISGCGMPILAKENLLPEMLFITSYPPRECGIATYSEDLIKSLNNKFGSSFIIRICPLESETEKHVYHDEIKYVLNTDDSNGFITIAKNINENDDITVVVIQHEFGFFEKKEEEFSRFLNAIQKPIVIVFHTVLPHPDDSLKAKVQQITDIAESIIVMTNSSSEVLIHEYEVFPEKISIIPHGTH
jgi:hypothetical protein